MDDKRGDQAPERKVRKDPAAWIRRRSLDGIFRRPYRGFNAYADMEADRRLPVRFCVEGIREKEQSL